MRGSPSAPLQRERRLHSIPHVYTTHLILSCVDILSRRQTLLPVLQLPAEDSKPTSQPEEREDLFCEVPLFLGSMTQAPERVLLCSAFLPPPSSLLRRSQLSGHLPLSYLQLSVHVSPPLTASGGSSQVLLLLVLLG